MISDFFVLIVKGSNLHGEASSGFIDFEGRGNLHALYDMNHGFSTPAASLSLKFAEPTDVAQTLRFREIGMMFSGFWRFPGVVLVNQARIDVFELQSVGQAEYQPELILPRVAIALGGGDRLGQRPARIDAFTRLVILNSSSDPGGSARPPGKPSCRRQRCLDSRTEWSNVQNFNANNRLEPFAEFVAMGSARAKHEDLSLICP